MLLLTRWCTTAVLEAELADARKILLLMVCVPAVTVLGVRAWRASPEVGDCACFSGAFVS